jgi:hypothetical protein
MGSAHRTGRKRGAVGACERECRRLRSHATGEMTAFDRQKVNVARYRTPRVRTARAAAEVRFSTPSLA